METIPARRGKATYVKQGQSIRIVNTLGKQVVDTWAFTAGMLTEFMSMEHTRATLTKMTPRAGDGLYTNRRRKILTMTEDTSRGDHDTLMAACDSERYILLGVKEYHDNCTDNLFAAMQGLGLTPPECPSPLNLFMNIPWTPNGTLSFDPPTTKPGDYVTLRAELDCIVAMSACPQDLLPINGEAGKPTEAHFEVIGYFFVLGEAASGCAIARDPSPSRAASGGAEDHEIFASTGRMYSRNFAGFSLIGKWPTSFMIVTSTPGIWLAVRSVSSAVQEKSYSPVSR